MVDVEIDSFVRKFKLLRDGGYKASLSLDTELGEVQISLSCKVGRIAPPPSSPPPQVATFINPKEDAKVCRSSPITAERNGVKPCMKQEMK